MIRNGASLDTESAHASRRVDAAATGADIAVMSDTIDNVTAEREVARTAFGKPHVFVLAAVGGPATEAVFRLCATETVVGRGGEVDIGLDDELVSQQHCRLRIEGSVCTILDLGSRNGTRWNGRDLRAGVAQRLRHLDEIEIGGTRFLVLAGRFTEG